MLIQKNPFPAGFIKTSYALSCHQQAHRGLQWPCVARNVFCKPFLTQTYCHVAVFPGISWCVVSGFIHNIFFVKLCVITTLGTATYSGTVLIYENALMLIHIYVNAPRPCFMPFALMPPCHILVCANFRFNTCWLVYLHLLMPTFSRMQYNNGLVCYLLWVNAFLKNYCVWFHTYDNVSNERSFKCNMSLLSGVYVSNTEY